MKKIIIPLFLFINVFVVLFSLKGHNSFRQPMPQNNVADIIVNRWSARAMSGEPITEEQLTTLFAAAQLAPSSYNGQPWRFIYAKRDSAHWDTLFNLLVDFNKMWCINAAVLVVVISKKNYDNGTINQTHSFDTGAACQNLALQGSADGLVVHGMTGFDHEKAQKALLIPDSYTVEAMFAIGKPGEKSDLPLALQKIEYPSDRNSLSSHVFEGKLQE